MVIKSFTNIVFFDLSLLLNFSILLKKLILTHLKSQIIIQMDSSRPLSSLSLSAQRIRGILRGFIFIKLLVSLGAGLVLMGDPDVFYNAAGVSGPAFPIRLLASGLLALGATLLSFLFTRQPSKWVPLLRLQIYTALLAMIACITDKVNQTVDESLTTILLVLAIAEIAVWSIFLAEFMGCGMSRCCN